MEAVIDFTNEEVRAQSIIKNAEYFTTVRFVDRRYERAEYATLPLAEAAAERMVKADPEARFLIYAVLGQSSTFVKIIDIRKEHERKPPGKHTSLRRHRPHG